MIINIGDVVVVNGGKRGMNHALVVAITQWRGQEHFILRNPVGSNQTLGFCYRQDIVKIAFRRFDDETTDFFSGQDWKKWLEIQHQEKSNGESDF